MAERTRALRARASARDESVVVWPSLAPSTTTGFGAFVVWRSSLTRVITTSCSSSPLHARHTPRATAPHQVSLTQYTALTLTGAFFSRYALLVSPINYVLCSVNIALFGSSAWHLGRKVKADFL